MAKKKAIRRKTSVVETKQDLAPNDAVSFDIADDDPILTFNVKDDQGVNIGCVEDTTTNLHRTCLVAQQEAFEDGNEEYKDYLSNLLTKKYNVKVGASAAYRMANIIFAMFGRQKKKFRWVIDLVEEFGVGVLSDDMKTPALLHILHSSKEKIHAHAEYRHRHEVAPLTGDTLRQLIFKVTGDAVQADSAKAHFDLADSKKERQ